MTGVVGVKEPALSGSNAGAGIARARWGLVFVGILALAAALRIYHLGSWPVEQDELYTLRDARAFGQWWNVRPVYFGIVRALLAFFPESPMLLRAPAALFGVLGVWLTWALGRQMFGPPAAAIATLLAAISPWHLYESQAGRYWSLVYALAALVYLLLPTAMDSDRRRDFVLVLGAIVVGFLTHPTPAFPLIGVALAVLLVGADGHIRRPRPSRRSWIWLWGPLIALGVSTAVLLLVTGNIGAYRNSDGRGLAGSIRLLPAMVQWAGPVVVAAAACGLYLLLRHSRSRDRRWAAMAGAGCVAGVVILMIASVGTDVYAQYGIAMLPLCYVTIGGAVQRLGEAMGKAGRGFTVGATAVIVAGVLPGTVSHLRDGTRFDYRPAYAHVLQTGGDPLVVGWPHSIDGYYAPELRFQELTPDTVALNTNLSAEVGFWLVGSHRRYGLMFDDGRLVSWIDRHCRRVLRTERVRFDYRVYRVELHWCGEDLDA